MAKGKNVSKAGSKIKLNPEPSSVTFKANLPRSWSPDAKEKAAKANKMVSEKRAAEASATTSKKALKAANKPAKLNKTQKSTADEARRLADKRARKAVAARKANPEVRLTTEQKYAYRKSLDRSMTSRRLGRGGAGIIGAFGIKNK